MMEVQASFPYEYGWNHKGVQSKGSDWHGWAISSAYDQISSKIEAAVNTGEFTTILKTSGAKITQGSFKFDKSGDTEQYKHWVSNGNNFLVVVRNLRIKPGTDGTKTKAPAFGARSWEAWCVMLADVEIWGFPAPAGI
eukprot:TRINITY_DN66591_c4_g15_i1.p1 TRINITY_DN66591_c4_g15~~TRINITY_DN66591_c4_g15_i1.p1  ORF type:complete len:147 (-),score=2.90 TRINITY_DN66591_c4_g15_i1:402-815(-)